MWALWHMNGTITRQRQYLMEYFNQQLFVEKTYIAIVEHKIRLAEALFVNF